MEKTEGRNWGIHLQFLTILLTIIGGFYTIDSKIQHQSERLDTTITKTSERTDKLYEMFITLVKENTANRHACELKDAEFDSKFKTTENHIAILAERIEWRYQQLK